MKIFELFDRKIEWEWDQSGYGARFTIDDLLYKVTMENLLDPSETSGNFSGIYEVEFSSTVQSDDTRQNMTNITNSGNSLAVMATVLEILQSFFSKMPSRTAIIFTAKELSRIRLYTAMAQRFKQKGWEVFDGPGSSCPDELSKYFFASEHVYAIIKP